MTSLLADADFTSLTGMPANDMALSLASELVRGFCGWGISQETVTASLDSDGRPVLELPTLLLTGVSALALNGNDPCTGQPWPALVEGTDWDWRTNGLLFWLQRTWLNAVGGWPFGSQIVTLTYTHGYSTAPGAIQAVVASAAQRIVQSPAVQSHLQNIGGISQNITYAQAVTAGAGLTASEQAALNRYRIASLR